MRLISCVALLMVIPAVALLTKEGDFPVNPVQVAHNQHNDKKSLDPVLFSLFTKADSVSTDSIDFKYTALSKQLDYFLPHNKNRALTALQKNE